MIRFESAKSARKTEKRAATNIPVVAPITAPSLATNDIKPPKTANRRAREAFNAYQREYMRKQRSKKKDASRALGS